MDFRRHLGERRYRLMVRMRRAAVEKIQHRRRLHRETVNGGKDWGGGGQRLSSENPDK